MQGYFAVGLFDFVLGCGAGEEFVEVFGEVMYWAGHDDVVMILRY